MRFTDQVRVIVYGGHGGSGSTALRSINRFRQVPDGGDGGDGGAVYFQGSNNETTLQSLAARRLIIAPNGQSGRSNRRHGRNGQPIVVLVPLGTMVFDKDENQLICDVTTPNHRYLIAGGGTGGTGNVHAGKTHSLVDQLGSYGQYRRLRCELKLLADVGLVGLPNAGKSSLLTAISNQRCRIGAFPFSTLTPTLGVVKETDDQTFVVADLPGIIAGSHTGKGLGINFLKHIERCPVLAIVLDISPDTSISAEQALVMLLAELNHFNPDLVHRSLVLVLNKIDLLQTSVDHSRLLSYLPVLVPIVMVSATQKTNLSKLKLLLQQLVQPRTTLTEPDSKQFNFCLQFSDFVIKKIRFNTWIIRFLTNKMRSTSRIRQSQVKLLLATLNHSIVQTQLRGLGVKNDDQIVVGQWRFVWQQNQLILPDSNK